VSDLKCFPEGPYGEFRKINVVKISNRLNKTAKFKKNNAVDDSSSDSDTIDYDFDSELDQSLRVQSSERGKIKHTELWRDNNRKRCRNQVRQALDFNRPNPFYYL